ncbi:unnamed protein product [Plutella xylostella]|uniref:(diamondback moth) hypothetical protein n=1 Tax=Plutella xylostella TaxID=51655 RepID=A0A8S4G7A9_PLUXY|nr:unnamed protein product [Plutella xylostella]
MSCYLAPATSFTPQGGSPNAEGSRYPRRQRVAGEVARKGNACTARHYFGSLGRAVEAATCVNCEEDDLDEELVIEKEITEKIKTPTGKRIMDIGFFFEQLKTVGSHGAMNCGIESLDLIGEKRIGFHSKFTFQCKMCNQKFCIENVLNQFDINVAAVAGTVSIGCGFSQLEEFSSALDLPPLSQQIYQKYHDVVSNNWEKELATSMAEAAAEEKAIAIKEGKGRLQSLETTRKRLKMMRKKVDKKRRFQTICKIEESKNYGENSVRPDVPVDMLDDMKSNFLESIQKSQEQRHEIEQKTILQSSSGEWLELRRTMLTASNFGKICKMRPETSCANTVKQLLYKGSVQAEPLQHGKEHEQMALAQLSKQEGIDIKPCGLFIDSEVPYLGATPDGISGEDVVVEVKCP